MTSKLYDSECGPIASTNGIIQNLIKKCRILGFPGGSVIKNLPANAGDTGLIPGSGRFLEKEMANYFSILAWEIPWTEEPDGLESMGSQESDMAKRLNNHNSNDRIDA